MSLSTALREYVAACFTGLWIQSHEHDDALAEIAQLCRDQDWRMAAWDIAQGLQIPGQTADTDAGGSDPLAAIQAADLGGDQAGIGVFAIDVCLRQDFSRLSARAGDSADGRGGTVTFCHPARPTGS